MDFEEGFLLFISLFIVLFLVAIIYGDHIAKEETNNICIKNNMSMYGYSTCYNESDNNLYQIINVNGTAHLIKTHI